MTHFLPNSGTYLLRHRAPVRAKWPGYTVAPMQYSTLTPRERAEVHRAIKKSNYTQQELADKIGCSSTVLTKFCQGEQERMRTAWLRQLLLMVGLDHRDYLPQLELKLTVDLEERVIQEVRNHFKRLRDENEKLRGSSFEGFVGIRVGGFVDKVFEGVFPLGDSDESGA